MISEWILVLSQNATNIVFMKIEMEINPERRNLYLLTATKTLRMNSTRKCILPTTWKSLEVNSPLVKSPGINIAQTTLGLQLSGSQLSHARTPDLQKLRDKIRVLCFSW